MELVDSLDLGAVTSVKVFFLYAADKDKSRFACFYKSWIKRNAPPRVPPRVKIRGTIEYAGVVELVDSVDLGDVTSVKVFPSRCHCEPVRTLVWQSVL